jgi:PAS domain S-box-containing protein
MVISNSPALRPAIAKLGDSERLTAVAKAALEFDQNAAFLDELTKLIQFTLEVPVVLVSLVTDERQVFKSARGLSEPVNTERETPLSHSFCQHVVTSGGPLIVSDAPNTELVCDNLAIRDLGVQAYLGTPILSPEGHVLGSLCAIDFLTRGWLDRELRILEGFSRSITAELVARSNFSRDMERVVSRLARITDHAPVMLAEFDKDYRYIFVNQAYAEMVKATPDEILGKEVAAVIGDTAFSEVESRMRAALAGETIEYDLQVGDAGEQHKYLRVKYVPETDECGETQSVIVAITDYTTEAMVQEKLEQSRQRLVTAHDLSPDGFMIFQAIRDDNGKIADFRFDYTNDAGAKIAGQPAEELIGLGLLEKLPGNRDEGLFDGYVSVVETGEIFRRTVYYAHDGLDLWIRITAMKLEDGFAVSFSDVTKRKQSEIALAENADRLQRILDNVVAFVGILDADGVLKEANQTALDAAGIAREDVVGLPFWETYWWSHDPKTQADLRDAIDRAKSGELTRYDVEIRVADEQAIWIDFQLIPLVNEDGSVNEMVPSGVDISGRKESEIHRELLVGELNHRVRNSLATIQAMARQTIRSASGMDEFDKTFSARLNAISAAHDIVMHENQGRASLQTMIERQIGPYASELSSQLKLSGRDVALSGPSAHAIGLVLHELATNAAKYGALSLSDGCIKISWQEAGNGFVDMTWEEKNGPPVSPPLRVGFGSRLIKQSLEYALGGTADLEYAPDGLIVRLQFPKDVSDE